MAMSPVDSMTASAKAPLSPFSFCEKGTIIEHSGVPAPASHSVIQSPDWYFWPAAAAPASH
jgi:hypothetical protein